MSDYEKLHARISQLVERNTGLGKEVDRLNNESYNLSNQLGSCDRERRALMAENKSLSKDAERYRWLRNGRGYFPEENMLRGGGELDIAIDAAISSPENH